MKLNILAFAAHPDDIELAASGTLMKHIAAGAKVGIVDLTQGELGSRGTIETRYDEAKKADAIIGIAHRVNLKMDDGFFEINEKNKRLIVEQIRRFQPDIVIANSITDRHPDHGRASQLVSEACFLSGLSKFQTSWESILQEKHRPKAVYHYIQDRFIKPDFVVDITEFVDRKIEAVKAYSTQFYNPESSEPITPISGEEFIEFLKGRMRDFGRDIMADFAEGFTVERTMGVQSLYDID